MMGVCFQIGARTFLYPSPAPNTRRARWCLTGAARSHISADRNVRAPLNTCDPPARMNSRRVVVAGGGAAGFFAAIACAEAAPGR